MDSVDSNFLRATHSFKMDLIPALERTLQGNVKPRMYPGSQGRDTMDIDTDICMQY